MNIKVSHGIFVFITLLSASLMAQKSSIDGTVKDIDTGESLIGVNIIVKNTFAGTISNQDGNFSLTTTSTYPLTLVFSCVGYEPVEMPIQGPGSLNIEMRESTIFGQEVVVSASKIEEKILSSSGSIEKLSIVDLQQTSAANFFDQLYQLKGVDMNINSLTFRYANTRGFTGEANYRMNQLVDGVENISPGLSFAAGNIFGMSQLDAESVELIVGASSALFGPGGMNGTLLMKSKDPFEYQGLSFNLQGGVMHVGSDYRSNPAPMSDVSLRYAKAYNDRWAFKVSGDYLTATDWHASDFRDRNDLKNNAFDHEANPGYDGVNVYGDDIVVPVNMEDVGPSIVDQVAQGAGLVPGTPEYEAFYNDAITYFPDQLITRTGWQEKYLADYNTTNLRVSGALHYRINERLEAIGQVNFSQGTSVYTTQNRFSANNFGITTAKLELKGPEFYVRTWAVAEQTGGSYDIGTTALRMNEAWKSSQDWYEEYFTNYTQTVLLGGNMQSAHLFARLVADNRDSNGNEFNEDLPSLPWPGTEEFDQLKQGFIEKPITEGGSKVVDKSKMWHIEGLYNFTRQIKIFELLVGVSHRIFFLNTEGTIFIDEPGEPIIVNQFGAFTQIVKRFLDERIVITGSARYDKNEYFKGQFTPRFSGVFALDNNKEHHLRASWQTAYRFPAASDQWVNFDVGFFRAVGGQPTVQQKYGFDTNPPYPFSGTDPINDSAVIDQGPYQIPTFGPEKVTAIELGYRGLLFEKSLYVDAYAFRNKYQGFLARIFLSQNPYSEDEQLFQTVIGTDEPVISWGWAFGGDLRLPRGFAVGGNVAYNELEEGFKDENIQARFNTPNYRFNIYIGNKALTKRLGFRVNFRWQNSFYWASNFGEDEMPEFATLDGHVSYKFPRLRSIIKIGGSNLLNKYFTTSFGSAQIGGLYYVSWYFDEFLN